MSQDLQTFLTLAQAIDAVAADFGQYDPQPELFRKISTLILGSDFKICILNGSERAWIRRNNDQPFELVNDTALGFYLIHVLETIKIDSANMAQICTLVFETPAIPGDLEGEPGVWIENQMNDFVCKRCGNCCRNLENACAREDLQLWESLGRIDILSWVKKKQLDNGQVQYRAWIDPQTGQPADSCPFLGQHPDTDLFYCTIHAIKPLVCREYPYTKKHAKKTGCRK